MLNYAKDPSSYFSGEKNSMCGCQSLTIFAINNGPGPSCSTIERTQFSAPNLDSKASNFASFSEEVFHICKFVPSWSITQKKGWISSSIMQRMQWENSHVESIGAHSFFFLILLTQTGPEQLKKNWPNNLGGCCWVVYFSWKTWLCHLKRRSPQSVSCSVFARSRCFSSAGPISQKQPHLNNTDAMSTALRC